MENLFLPAPERLKFSLHELSTITGGTFHQINDTHSQQHDVANAAARDLSFSIDSRTLQPDQVFLALHGPSADGHDYLEQAIHKGACGLIIHKPEAVTEPLCAACKKQDMAEPPFLLQVDDTLVSLQTLAQECRQRHRVPLAGITGSNGKTTVKDMVASILSVRYGDRVLKSEKSFNNHIGLPLTLVNMQEHHAIAVIEMGMNAPGEIQHLAQIAAPDCGAVTNIAQAHAGFFDSIESILHAKMELLDALPDGATAILNRDDPLFKKMLPYLRDRLSLVTFGLGTQPGAASSSGTPTVTARNLAASPDAAYSFVVENGRHAVPVSLNIPGYHNVHNALAAVAIASTLLAQESQTLLHHDEIKEGLEHFQPSPMRMQVITRQNVTFLHDAYNANPKSMASALETLKMMRCSGRKIAVLGDMYELGELSQQAHYDVGKAVAAVPVTCLFLLGDYAEETARGARDAGLTATHIVIGTSHEHLGRELTRYLQAGDLVLCKASRGMTLENVVDNVLKSLPSTD